MSADSDNKPKRQRLRVTEETPGKNEMSRVKRRTVTLPLREASEDDLQEFEHLHNSDSADMPFESRLIRDLAAIEARLDELDLPPPRGWVEVRKDDSWAPVPEDKSARMVIGRGTMVEMHDPEASVWIETSVNFIKRRAKAYSLPWWLGYLGELIICIIDEPDPDKHRTLILSYGSDRQRYLDQHGHLDDIRHGRKFSGKKTDKATRGRSRKRATREEGVISLCNRALRKGKGRKKNGGINCSELARIYIDAGYREIGEQRVRKIISQAIRVGILV